jgi:hypothetical protein
MAAYISLSSESACSEAPLVCMVASTVFLFLVMQHDVGGGGVVEVFLDASEFLRDVAAQRFGDFHLLPGDVDLHSALHRVVYNYN